MSRRRYIPRNALWAFLGTAVLSALLISAQVALAEGGAIEGKLRNGTAGTSAPVRLEVTLEKLDGKGIRAVVERTETDERGDFRFGSVDATAGFTYTAIAKYWDVEYRSTPVNFDAGATAKPVELVVYETTEEDTALRVEVGHAVIEADLENDGLWVIEVAVFSNTGDRTYIGDPRRVVEGKRATLRFSLPAGAQHFQPSQGLNPDDAIEIVNGYADSAPVLPGSRQVVYEYMVPFAGKDAIYSRAVDYPTQRFTALIAESGGQIEAAQMEKGEPMELGGRRYQTFVAQDVPVGGAIMLRQRDVTITASQPTEMTMAVVGVAALALASGFVIFLRRRARASGIEKAPGKEREELLAAIAELDDAFEAGEIDEPEYRAERDAQKRRLTKLRRVQVEG